MRAEDSVFRQGGDEFAVIVPETDAEEVGEVVARLCSPRRHRGFGSDEERPVSASAGFAMFPADGTTAEDLLGFADRDLFGAKRGRALAPSSLAAALDLANGAGRDGREAMRRATGAALVLLALGGMSGVAAASPGSARTAIVSLGDSFISGEGGRWLGNGSEPFGTRSGTDRAAFDCDGWGLCEYDPARVYGDTEDNGCHRSDVAPIRSAPVAVDERINLACSGAKAANLWPAPAGGQPHFGEPPQVDRLAAIARRDDVRMVVVTVGANDVGFGELVAGCALDWARSSEQDPVLCRAAPRPRIDAALPAMERGLRRALRGVREALAAAGYRRPDYRLVTVGLRVAVPGRALVPLSRGRLEPAQRRRLPVWNADADWAAGEGIGSIVAAMRAAAAATGAEFLDLRHALDGHQLCDRRSRRVGPEGPSPLSAEWVRRLAFVQGSSRESLHPNAYGQRAIGACIGLLYAAPAATTPATPNPAAATWRHAAR